MSANEEIVAHLIETHRRAIRFSLGFALGLFLLGIGVILVPLIFGALILIPTTIVQVAGGLISSLSALPTREILEHQDKAERATIVQTHYRAIIQSPDSVSEEERKRIVELMTQLVNSAM